MDLGHGLRGYVTLKKLFGTANGKAQIRQAALIAPARGIANDYRENIETQVIVSGSPNGAAD
jgi:hypothetical protein